MAIMRKTSFILGLLVLIMVHSPAWAQVEKYNYDDDGGPGFNSGNRFLLGYAVNIPNQYLGVTIGVSRPQAVGLFLEYKMDLTTLEIAPYLSENLTVEDVETIFYADTLKDSRYSWISVNGGITWPINDHFCSYLGLGASFHKAYRQYREPYTGGISADGSYWVRDESNSTVNLNITGGVYYKLGRYFYLQLGGDIRPLGLVAGLGLAP
jgi:opacity protein-like surface antigen